MRTANETTTRTADGRAQQAPSGGAEAEKVGARRSRWAALLAAPVAGLLTWAVVVPVLGVELSAREGAGVRGIGPVDVTVAAVLVAAAGWLLLAVLDRWGRPRVWLPVAVGVLVLSLVGTLGATSPAAMAGLASLHVVVGLTVIGTLRPGR